MKPGYRSLAPVAAAAQRFLRGPTSEDGATPRRPLSSLSSGDSLQRAAIVWFQSAEEEGVFQRPHRGEPDQLITITQKKKKRKGEEKKKILIHAVLLLHVQQGWNLNTNVHMLVRFHQHALIGGGQPRTHNCPHLVGSTKTPLKHLQNVQSDAIKGRFSH